MSTRPIERLFDYARQLREAEELLESKDQLTVDDLVKLTRIKNALSRLKSDKVDILIAQVLLDNTSKQHWEEAKELIISTCDAFSDIYVSREEDWDKQCSVDNVYSLVDKRASSDFYFEEKEAQDEAQKWSRIFRKYNDVTRLYNSMECRPDEKKKDMQILHGYLEELYDMVGRPVSLENINIEHDEAHSTLREKEKKVETVSSHKRESRYAYLKQIDSDVINIIYCYALDLRCGLVPPVKEEQGEVPEKKPKRGRPNKQDRYTAAHIVDFATCFDLSNQTIMMGYEQFCEVLRKEPDNSITSATAEEIATRLIYNNIVKREMTSREDLIDFMIKEFSSFHFNKGGSLYNRTGRVDYDLINRLKIIAHSK